MIKLYLILFFISIESSSQYGDDLRHLKIKKRDTICRVLPVHRKKKERWKQKDTDSETTWRSNHT